MQMGTISLALHMQIFRNIAASLVFPPGFCRFDPVTNYDSFVAHPGTR
jgi:hypothetical protein